MDTLRLKARAIVDGSNFNADPRSRDVIIIIIIIKTFITRKFAEAANARSVDCTEEKRFQSLFEDVQRDVR